MNRPQEYAKAISGAILAGLGVLYVALADNVVSAQEWVAVAQAAGAAFAVVYGIPNAAKQNTVSQQKVTVETTQVAAPAAVADVALADGADHAEIPLATPESDPEDATVTGL